jgi:nucleotide-binding universal stress UspA family protein
METNDVVVGVDGSTGSRQALRWATAEARRRAGRLRVIAAYSPSWPLGAAWARAEETVAEMVAVARSAAPELVVTGLSVNGEPVPVLTAAVHDGALLVVGNRGHSGVANFLLGTTGLQLATRAPGSVVIVRGDTDHTGPVVVGVDEPPAAEPAIATAFRTAADHGCPLRAVHAYDIPVPRWGERIDPLYYDLERLQGIESASLLQSIEPWRQKYPDVPVEAALKCGKAATVLTVMSAEARLVVVGTCGHGGFASLLLGSVSRQLLHHAHCPVLVAR